MPLTAGAQKVQVPPKPGPSLGPQPKPHFSPKGQSSPLKLGDSMMDISSGSWSSSQVGKPRQSQDVTLAASTEDKPPAEGHGCVRASFPAVTGPQPAPPVWAHSRSRLHAARGPPRPALLCARRLPWRHLSLRGACWSRFKDDCFASPGPSRRSFRRAGDSARRLRSSRRRACPPVQAGALALDTPVKWEDMAAWVRRTWASPAHRTDHSRASLRHRRRLQS